jgi:hypothetical protein
VPAFEMSRDLLGVEWQHSQLSRRATNEAVEKQEVFRLLGS